MKAIICGGRYYEGNPEIDFVYLDKLRDKHNIIEVVSGNSNGADLLGERWAKSRKLELSVFKANWQLYGYSAGPIRNRKMLEYIKNDIENGIVIAFPGGRGTQNMCSIARMDYVPVILMANLKLKNAASYKEN